VEFLKIGFKAAFDEGAYKHVNKALLVSSDESTAAVSGNSGSISWGTESNKTLEKLKVHLVS
jgi:hypothetical protein